jgi:hypothetical protein
MSGTGRPLALGLVVLGQRIAKADGTAERACYFGLAPGIGFSTRVQKKLEIGPADLLW